jgi:hypothetical protein
MGKKKKKCLRSGKQRAREVATQKMRKKGVKQKEEKRNNSRNIKERLWRSRLGLNNKGLC